MDRLEHCGHFSSESFFFFLNHGGISFAEAETRPSKSPWPEQITWPSLAKGNEIFISGSPSQGAQHSEWGFQYHGGSREEKLRKQSTCCSSPLFSLFLFRAALGEQQQGCYLQKKTLEIWKVANKCPSGHHTHILVEICDPQLCDQTESVFIRIPSAARNRKHNYKKLREEDNLLSHRRNAEIGPFQDRLTGFKGSGFCQLFHAPCLHVDCTYCGCKVTMVALVIVSSHKKDRRQAEGNRTCSFHVSL